MPLCAGACVDGVVNAVIATNAVVACVSASDFDDADIVVVVASYKGVKNVAFR